MVLRDSMRPLVHALRSALGTHGLAGRLAVIEGKLASLETSLQARQGSAPESSPPPPAPETKMESAAQLFPAHLNYVGLTGAPPAPPLPSTLGAGSRLCRQADFSTDGFRYWANQMKVQPTMHRKLWEWYFAADALWRVGMLQKGRRGLGFGVGQEPLTPLFAMHGCTITATDMNPEDAMTAGWAETHQHASSLAALDNHGIAPPDLLQQRVAFRTVDMNNIPPELTGFDFCWSSCSLEHLGSLRHGADFVVNAMRCLAPGGVAVHTTEFNLGSDDATFETPTLSLYRRRDIAELVARLEENGHRVEPIDWSIGEGLADGFVDLPPYAAPIHLRLQVAGHECTSIGLIVHARNHV